MRKAGLLTLVISLVVSGFLLLVWLLGFGLAGNLIHLLLILSLPIGITGGAAGIVLLVVSAFQSKDAGGQPLSPLPPSRGF